jgi:dolichol-phosphate mannosyltransferase
MSSDPQSAIGDPPSRLLVALATYNEIETLPSLVAAIRAHLPDADVLVVDDNSPDGTGRWCDDEAAQSPWLSVIHRPKKLGLGSATWTAMQAAIDRGYELLVTLDADWSHPPERLPALAAAAANADVVVGSRYCRGGRVDGWPWTRRVVSRAANSAARMATGIPLHDFTGAYRAYRIDLLRRLDFSRLQATGFDYLEEIAWRLHRLGARFAEVPITFSDRRAGTSKVHAGEAWRKARVLAGLAWQRATGGGR